ncbi:MAG TPA: hypothetical protein VLI46_08450 [Ramlibacter sp.]|nr:hypothetical protein [Ramlibacter sp.]
MNKHLTAIAALLLAGTVHAQSGQTAGELAHMGIAADLGTTAIGLSMGFAEANPLGVAVIPLKFIAKAQIDKIENPYERREAMASFTGMQFGAAAANLCTIAAANPALAVLCFAGGAVLGYQKVKAVPTEDECVQRHMAQLEEAVATGRRYRITLKTCQGAFEPEPLLAEPAGPAKAMPQLVAQKDETLR